MAQGVRDLAALKEKRAQALYQWLRHLLLLAAGGLTLMVSLRGNTTVTGIDLIALRTAWIALGTGILSGAIALYGEVSMQRRLEESLAEKYKALWDAWRRGNTDATFGPVSIPPTWWMVSAERLCYLTLATAVIALVVFGCLQAGSPPAS
jgi:hypothetical protein